IVVSVTPPRSRSARGNTDAGPGPRQTATVGTSWRILLQAQRSCGNLRKEPSAKRIALSCDGGNPVIHPSVRGSLSADVGGGSVCGVGVVIRSFLVIATKMR